MLYHFTLTYKLRVKWYVLLFLKKAPIISETIWSRTTVVGIRITACPTHLPFSNSK